MTKNNVHFLTNSYQDDIRDSARVHQIRLPVRYVLFSSRHRTVRLTCNIVISSHLSHGQNRPALISPPGDEIIAGDGEAKRTRVSAGARAPQHYKQRQEIRAFTYTNPQAHTHAHIHRTSARRNNASTWLFASSIPPFPLFLHSALNSPPKSIFIKITLGTIFLLSQAPGSRRRNYKHRHGDSETEARSSPPADITECKQDKPGR